LIHRSHAWFRFASSSWTRIWSRTLSKPWGDRLKDRRFETEGEWKNKLQGGTRGTVEALTRELRDALR